MLHVLSSPPTRLVLQRHTGPLSAMGHGCWKASHAVVWFSCADCGCVTDIDAADIATNGDVAGEFICQEVRCDFVRLITLSGWSPFDTSDVKP